MENWRTGGTEAHSCQSQITSLFAGHLRINPGQRLAFCRQNDVDDDADDNDNDDGNDEAQIASKVLCSITSYLMQVQV